MLFCRDEDSFDEGSYDSDCSDSSSKGESTSEESGDEPSYKYGVTPPAGSKGFRQIKNKLNKMSKSLGQKTRASNVHLSESDSSSTPVKVNNKDSLVKHLKSKDYSDHRLRSSPNYPACRTKLGKLNKKSVTLTSAEKMKDLEDRVNFFKSASLKIDKLNPNLPHDVPESDQVSNRSCSSQSELSHKDQILYCIQNFKFMKSEGILEVEEAYDNLMKTRKERLDEVSMKILNFKFNGEIPNSKPTRSDYAKESTLSCQSIFRRCEELSAKEVLVKDAMDEIEYLLEEMSSVQELFFSEEKFQASLDKEKYKEVSERIKVLCIWKNLVSQMAFELHMFAHKLFVDKIPDLKWPFLNYMPKTMAEHSICPLKLNVHAEEKVENKQKVEFHAGDPAEEKSDKHCHIRHSQSIANIKSSMYSANGSTYIYRIFVERTLRKSGLKKVEDMAKNSIFSSDSILAKVRMILLPIDKAKKELSRYKREIAMENENENRAKATKTDRDDRKDCILQMNAQKHIEKLHARQELITFGEHSKLWRDMNLPSLKDLFLFSLRVILDVIHECLRCRLEQSREQFSQNCFDKTTTSLLSINQLMCECGEILKASVTVKKFFLKMVCDIVRKVNIEEFDSDMDNMLSEHIKYMRFYVQKIEHEPHLSKYLIRLEGEWNFTRTVCPYVRQGDAKAGNGYCDMVNHLLSIIQNFFITRLDKITGNLQFLDEQPSESEKESPSGFYEDASRICREIKEVFDETKERTARVMGLAKMLRNDLEIAAQYRVVCSVDVLLRKLKKSNHMKIELTIFDEFIVLVPESMTSDTESIVTLLRATSSLGIVDCEENQGYLIMVKFDESKTAPKWTGKTMRIKADVETEICWSHLNIEGLLIVTHARQLTNVRCEIESELGPSCIEMILDQVACHKAVNESLVDMKKAGLEFRTYIKEYIQEIQTATDKFSKCFTLKPKVVDTMKRIYNFGFDFHTDLYRLMSGKQKVDLSVDVIDFALEWMSLACKNFEKGRGVKPRWTAKFFEYLRFVSYSEIPYHISEEKYHLFKEKYTECINHIIGDKSSGEFDHKTRKRKDRHSVSSRSIYSDSRKLSDTSDSFISPVSGSSETNSFAHLSSVETTWSTDDIFERRIIAINRVEKEREEQLYKEKIIGRVTDVCNKTRYGVSLREVTFNWQRGVKIGEGRFGKVYTAVKLKTGEMMAMKEITVKPNDHQFVMDVADELKNFEGLNHEGIIKYFGVEIHHDQMLIFMEYCQGGTLHEAAKVGLDEATTRFYTNKIVHAVAFLHENKIIHRDIKGDNIFLTKCGLKLGDFGSAVKLREQKTKADDRSSARGTTIRFQPPEVVKNSSLELRYRFAADIWSLGCVVTEMLTGKLPWSELNIINEFQMMYHIATANQTPKVPENACDDLRKFLEHCFEMDPEKRATAEELLDETFIKVDSEIFKE
ncbi:DgyrCDS5829 [Dimorphilus gyrociliatus]|uniref:DgyrCDS5829 n=1 Tax=Dimorphilus gyrociliatus TaxID=2664684 RepID=A0A7I8VNF4_9ANNE|nr:DgyrCDS5829 [Dimorphilus gyrociliatus]